MQDLGSTLQYSTLFLLILWRLYWDITEKRAEHEKPKKREKVKLLHKKNLSMIITFGAFLPVTFQLVGFEILPFPKEYAWMQMAGFGLVLLGWLISVRGRHDLGTNWARSYNYQIKDKQELVTSGVYKYIRHPIYSGIMFMFIGSELIVQSYLVLAYLLLYYGVFLQTKWEETLLIEHFGKAYKVYMGKTKRLIPFIW
jgi:protein-S-isoprenylcysteine O-methyltransferase Ste14